MHYRDAIIWQKAFDLAETCYRLAASLPPFERYGLRAQLTRAAVSVVSNIAEGWTRESRRDKANFLAIAQGSLAELHTQLLLAIRLGWLHEASTPSALGLVDETSRLLTTYRRRLRD
ncbi:four helix bundle protein [Arenimonas composti]|nr:four helix bundle protein [Arenimonas composti]